MLQKYDSDVIHSVITRFEELGRCLPVKLRERMEWVVYAETPTGILSEEELKVVLGRDAAITVCNLAPQS